MNSNGKTEVSGFYKLKEGIVVNRDNEGLVAYKKKKNNTHKLKNFEKDLATVKSDIEEIKNLLKGLIK